MKNNFMNRNILLVIVLFSLCTTTFGQAAKSKTMFVVDSIPVIISPERFDEIMLEDIANISIIKNRDSLKILGLSQFDSVTYIFTKEYRNRPDSIKRIPSLKQMEIIDGVWSLLGIPYSGKYIDYYINGRKQNEGELVNGKLNGTLFIYFQNGHLLSESHYINGIENGIKSEYYKNGVLRLEREYKEGKYTNYDSYYINGQRENYCSRNIKKKGDTCFTYYSTGKLKSFKIIKNGRVVFNSVNDDINYYELKFNESMSLKHDIKEAAKYCAKLFKLDSTVSDIYFKRGLVLYWQYRFDEAINEFDKGLKIEPLMSGALAYRGLARLKKYQFLGTEEFTQSHKLGLLYAWVTTPVSNDEQEKVCNDLQLADELGFRGDMIFVKAISFYCGKK